MPNSYETLSVLEPSSNLHYLAIDPGAGFKDSIGVAKFSATGQAVLAVQYTFDDFVDFLEAQTDVGFIIFEEYRIRRNRMQSHVGSKVETIQTIGVIKSWCRRKKVPFIEQPSGILSIASQWFQIKWPIPDHANSHYVSATLHGLYALKLMGVVKTALEAEIGKTGD